MTRSAEPVLSLRSLRVDRGSGAAERRVVDGLDIDLHAGETVGLVGESGCGKTATALALMGLVPARWDRLSVGSNQLEGTSEKDWQAIRGRDIAMVFQEPMTSLDPVFRVGTQVAGVLKRHLGLSRAESEVRVEQLMDAVGLDAEAARLYPHQMSGGQRQRVMMAMAMSCSPRVLIADEATTALDVTTQADVLGALGELQAAAGTGVLLITHDLGVVAQHCDRVLVMYAGRIVEQADCGQLFSNPGHPYTRGLLEAVPRLSSGPPRLVSPIPGQAPAPGAWRDECRFRDRCTRGIDICAQATPELSGEDHRVACHNPATAAKDREH